MRINWMSIYHNFLMAFFQVISLNNGYIYHKEKKSKYQWVEDAMAEFTSEKKLFYSQFVNCNARYV